MADRQQEAPLALGPLFPAEPSAVVPAVRQPSPAAAAADAVAEPQIPQPVAGADIAAVDMPAAAEPMDQPASEQPAAAAAPDMNAAAVAAPASASSVVASAAAALEPAHPSAAVQPAAPELDVEERPLFVVRLHSVDPSDPDTAPPAAADAASSSSDGVEVHASQDGHALDEEEHKSSPPPPSGSAASDLSIDPVSPVSPAPAVAAVADRPNVQVVDWSSPLPVAAAPSVAVPVVAAQHIITIDNTDDAHAHQHLPAVPPPAIVGVKPPRSDHHTSTNTTTSSTWRDTQNLSATRPSPLKNVPLEVIGLMLSYCDAQTLVHFGRTSSLHNSLSCKKNLWTALLQTQPWNGYQHAGQPINGVRMDASAKKYYAERRKYALQRRREKLDDHERSMHRVRLNHRAWWTYMCTDFALVPCVTIFACIFLICLVYQLAKHQAINFMSMWPLLAIVGFMAVATTILCCAKWLPERDAVLHGQRVLSCCFRWLPADFFEQSASIVKDFMEAIGQGESRRAHVSFCVMLSALGTFVVFLVLKVTNHIGWNWWWVFFPLYVVFGSWCCAPCFRWPDTSRIKIKPCVAVWCALGLPLLAFVILLTFKLQNDSILLTYALIPLFFLDLLMLIGAIWFCFDEETPVGLLVWLGVDGPLLTFKILLCVYVDQQLSGLTPGLLFIPLYVTQLMLLCGCVVLTGIISDESNVDYDDAPDEVDIPLPPV